MFHYGLCHMNIQEAPRVLPNSLKGQRVCYHVYVIGAHKKNTCGPLEHAQPLYFYLPWVNVCMSGSTEGDW